VKKDNQTRINRMDRMLPAGRKSTAADNKPSLAVRWIIRYPGSAKRIDSSGRSSGAGRKNHVNPVVYVFIYILNSMFELRLFSDRMNTK